MKYRILLGYMLLVLLQCALLAKETEQLTIKGKAPKGLNTLAIDIKSNFVGKINYGSYNMKEYCYHNKHFVVYQEDLILEGYILSKEPPKNLKCFPSPYNILEQNSLGLYIGMPKQKVEKLIKVSNLRDTQIIEWQSIEIEDSVPWDIITHAKFIFLNEKLIYLKVIFTETN